MKAEIASKHFGDKQILDRIALDIPEGQVVALIGPSGIGKSTLVRIISGLETRFEGHVAGVGRVGMVFQEPTLLPWRSVTDNLIIATSCSTADARNALQQVELGTRLEAYPAQLSLGQQRRVALARALAARPQTLILDEAFVSLDEATATRMRDLTTRLLDMGGFRTILVTHNYEDAVALADRILVLGGSPASIRLDFRIKQPRAQRDIAIELLRVRDKISRADLA